jgi:hypothetical protein
MDNRRGRLCVRLHVKRVGRHPETTWHLVQAAGWGPPHEHPHEVSTEAVDNFVGKLGTRAQSARLIGDCTGLLLF